MSDLTKLDLIGNTPLVRLTKIEKQFNIKANLYAKLESFNVAGSIKDRVAKHIIESYESQGIINNDSVIIEATSGNTGIGLALVCKLKGYKCVIVMPENMSVERVNLIKSYGAKVVLTDKNKGMSGAIERAERIKRENKNSIIIGQFENPYNSEAHYLTTAPEIYKDLNGEVSALFCAVGTGGTITGVGRYLKDKINGVKVYAIEPFESAVLSGEKAGAHEIQGIGAGFIPKVLDVNVYDKVIKVKSNDAFEYMKILNTLEFISAGISSGACLAGALSELKNEEFTGKNVVLIFPDGIEKYVSVLKNK